MRTSQVRSIALTAAITFSLRAFGATTLSTLVTFPNGVSPYGTLITDGSGNFYGVTQNGGANGYGSVFEAANNSGHTLTTLASFSSASGQTPQAGLLADGAGNLYGTTEYGGSGGYGTVFKVANDPSHTLTTLASFNYNNGYGPRASLIADAGGNLYGTTMSGAGNNAGVVFRVANDANHTLTDLVTFSGPNGSNPEANLLSDAAGNLYGTTYGASEVSQAGYWGYGGVFKLSNDANHTLTQLATFHNTDGWGPTTGLVADAQGNLYGTTQRGGLTTQNFGLGYGTVFKVANDANHTLATLAVFNSDNGSSPNGALLMDAAGDLFGTTSSGGADGVGTVFEIANDGQHTFTTLASFTLPLGTPEGALIADAAGNLYGTTSAAGSNYGGRLFELTGTGFVTPEPATTATGLAVVMFSLARGRRRRRCNAPRPHGA